MKSIVFRRLKIEHLWGLATIISVFVFLNTHPIRPNDFWWHLAVGREILTTGSIPRTDIYSFTMIGQPYPSYQMFWLMEIALYSLYRFGGPTLVVFVNSLIVTAAYGLLLWTARQASGSWRAASLATLFAMALGFNDWNVRPQVISYLLGAMYLWAIYGYRRRPRPAWLAVFPLGMLVWVNSHGSFVIGLVLLCIWLADEAWVCSLAWLRRSPDRSLKGLREPAIALALASLVCLANPRGPSIASYMTTLTTNPVVRNLVTEWAPPTFETLGGAIFLIGLLTSAILLAVSPRRPGFFQLATFFVFGVLGLQAVRGSVWFGLVMAPILAQHLASLAQQIAIKPATPPRRSGSPIVNGLFLFLLVALACASLPWIKPHLPLPEIKAGLISQETPVQATAYLLVNRPPGHLFHDMAFGSYLIWAAQPDYPVFVDPRIELYPAEMWREYLILVNGLPGWEEKLEIYGIRTLMLSPENQKGLIEAVDKSSHWHRIYQDKIAVIYTRE